MLHRLKYLLLIITLIPSCLNPEEEEVYFLSEIYFPELEYKIQKLSLADTSEFWINIIDFGTAEDFEAGHINFAQNIPLPNLVDSGGFLVNQGKVITANYDDRWDFVVYSSSNDTIAYHVANLIQSFGYRRVYYYTGGVDDWLENGAALQMTYEGFKKWYDQHYPFNDTMQSLIDVQDESWFNGNGPLMGHIPGAINIPAAMIADTTAGELSIVNDGVALTDTVRSKSAKIVVYTSGLASSMSESFLEAASLLGYTNLYQFPSGYEEWELHGNTFE